MSGSKESRSDEEQTVGHPPPAPTVPQQDAELMAHYEVLRTATYWSEVAG